MISRFVVVRSGDILREETINVAILMWVVSLGSKAPVSMRILRDWSRLRVSFGWSDDVIQEGVVHQLSRIRIKDDYDHLRQELGHYSFFEFSEERCSLASPNEVLDNIAGFYLVEGSVRLRK